MNIIKRIMPRAKKAAAKAAPKPRARKPVAPKAEVAEVKPEPVETPVTEVKEVRFEGAVVQETLSFGHTDSAYHCRMSDGTTKHVPKQLFHE